MVAAVLLLTSCLNSDEIETTVYSDMAISTFTLGTLNRYLHTSSSTGTDSVYSVTYAAGGYKMNIDQLEHTISNADSLLTGTDVAHVICHVTAKNNGLVFVMPLDSETPVYFNSGTDSIDFTQPRVFRVYATDRSGFRDYTVSLNVRTQDAGVFSWTSADAADFPQTVNEAAQSSAEAIGMTYIGDTNTEAYAMNADGIIMKTGDNGVTWQEERFDTDVAKLPVGNMAYTSWTLDTYTDYALLVGQNAEVSDKAMVQWRKLVDDNGGAQWVYMPLDGENAYYLPLMDHVALVFYNGVVLAFGSDKNVYASRDQGITWRTTSTYSFPEGLDPARQLKAAVDAEGYVWLKEDVDGGRAWKGKLSD